MPVTSCPLCGSAKLNPITDLGFHPLADTFLKEEQLQREESRFPLCVSMCGACGHAMNSYRVPPAKRYTENDYSYDSSNSKVSIMHFSELAADVIAKTNVVESDLVVDIGGNVGTLLQAFRDQKKAEVLNVEPASNIAEIAEKNGIPTLRDFFNSAAADAIVKRGGAKAITSTNSFNHIDELDEFMQNIARTLRSDGIFVFEVPYLLHLVEKMAFDTIYLEHVSYFAIKPLVPFFKKYGLVITDIVENDYMGGSIRVVAAKQGNESPSVAECIAREEKAAIFGEATYENLMEKIRAFKVALLKQLIEAKASGGRIIGIGAATKGNTLLNYCGIDNTLLDFITDASPLKIGKFTPGSHIRIEPDEAINDAITHALILPWNIAEFLKGKLAPKYPKIVFITPHM